jgi:hypothetical protein
MLRALMDSLVVALTLFGDSGGSKVPEDYGKENVDGEIRRIPRKREGLLWDKNIVAGREGVGGSGVWAETMGKNEEVQDGKAERDWILTEREDPEEKPLRRGEGRAVAYWRRKSRNRTIGRATMTRKGS